MSLSELKKELKSLENPEKAKIYSRFFKTGKGEYGEGDIFLGLTVPETRSVVAKYKEMSLEEVDELLDSEIHEERFAALLILVHKYDAGDEKVKKEIYNFYLGNAKKVNNWDLVDSSAHKIVGDYLKTHHDEKQILYDLAQSENLWERRISIIATAAFININEFDDVFAISEILLNDPHDLIHKAVGWMLREVGKRDGEAERKFLKKFYKNMPRTMLRYAIEKFPEEERKKWLKNEI